MTDRDPGRAVDEAFAAFRAVATERVTAPGVRDVRARARRRATIRRAAAMAVVAMLGAGAALAGSTRDSGPFPTPPVAVGLPTGSASDRGDPSASGGAHVGPTIGSVPGNRTPGRPSTSGRPSRSSAASPARSAHLSVSVSDLSFSPADVDRREGSLRVRVDNAGPAAARLVLTVRTPAGVEPAGPGLGGCDLSGSGGTYRCRYGPLAAGGVASFSFQFTAPPGEVRPGPADRRSVTVERDAGRDPDTSDNRATYLVRG